MTFHRIFQMRASGEKITMLTCYDALFARVLNDAHRDIVLVGDSLASVLQGHATTLVAIDEMAYHVSCTARANRHAWLIADCRSPAIGNPRSSAFSMPCV